ncbi:hypothetical protein OOK27_40775 [Streptomyces canus]|uniref:hypothetical protein n=1 Tax=Streptomyces canus TaxID=58343 RepID=UPI00225244A4|nr:hypothetical protein [Streptomyces canus]MCX5260412.1 hypothetical protein [Streptomyces canus]
MMSCSDCHSNLDETPVGEPCPSCGSGHRSATAYAEVALVATAALNASGSIGYNALRPWQQKWRDVINGLDVIEATYRQNDLDNEAVRRQVETFFKDCCELADWLQEQAGTSAAVDYLKSDPDLKLCDGMAQTTKHHTRAPSRKRDPITARISRVDGGQGVRAEIQWSTQSGSTGTEDALDSAQRCKSAWERFFRQYGLTP